MPYRRRLTDRTERRIIQEAIDSLSNGKKTAFREAALAALMRLTEEGAALCEQEVVP